MTGDELVVRRADHHAEIVLNRPHRRNALTERTVEALTSSLATLEDDSRVHAVLLRGAGATWSSGLDLKEVDVARFGPMWQQLHRNLSRMSTPIVGALEGAAINAGAALALACDVVIAGRSAYAQIMEATLGMAAPVNTAWLLARHSPALGARLVLTAERITGERLVDLGLAHVCVDDPDVMAVSQEVVQRIASHPRGAAALVKAPFSVLLEGGRTSFEAHLDSINASAGGAQ